MTNSEARPTLEQRILVVCGTVVALSGLWNLASADGTLDTFLGAALVWVGSMLVLPQLVVLGIKRQG